MNIYNETIGSLPQELINFALVVLFSLLIGLEQREHYQKAGFESRFGTDRTYTFIGILGFLLYLLNPVTLAPFLWGGAFVGILLGIFYVNKITLQKEYGITSILVAFITYCLAPIIYTQQAWFVILLVVVILVLVKIKGTLFEFSKKFDSNEFITLAKFLVIAGVILPLLSTAPISETITFSPYKFWLAIVAVSSISYFSYLLKKFVFPNSGVMLTGILGGLYSSTATTFILAKKSKELNDDNKITASILLATSMMFVRIFVLAFLFNRSIAIKLAPAFTILLIASVLIAFYFFRLNKTAHSNGDVKHIFDSHSNPLEFKASLIFGILFIAFAFLTGFVSKAYGAGGIKILSFVVGVTDIDPFIMNIFQSQWLISDSLLAMAVINATTSNSVLKMIYGISLASKSIHRSLMVGFGILIVIGLLASAILTYY